MSLLGTARTLLGAALVRAGARLLESAPVPVPDEDDDLAPLPPGHPAMVENDEARGMRVATLAGEMGMRDPSGERAEPPLPGSAEERMGRWR